MNIRVLTVLGLTCTLLTSAACDSKGPVLPPATPQPTLDTKAPDSSGIGLPTPALRPAAPVQPRGTSESALVVDNTFVFADSGGSSGPGAGGSFDIIPTTAEPGWAVYRVPLASDARPHTWNLNLTAGGQGLLRWWIAAYSFSDMRWQWLGEEPGLAARPRTYDAHNGSDPVQVHLNDPLLRSRFVSADNGGVEAYFAIVLEPASQGGTSLNVQGSSLESFELGDTGFTPVEPLPAEITGVSADVGQGTLTLDITSGGDADFLFLQRRERVSGTSSLKGPSAVNPWEDLGSVPGFVTQFIDPDMSIPSAPPPAPNTPYEYRVQSFNLDGSTQLYSAPSVPQILTLAANQPPVARLHHPGTAEVGVPVALNASTSYDTDGTIADYEWDFDGDGTFNETDNGEDTAQGSPTAQASYPAGGLIYPTIRITDDGGSTDSATAVNGVTLSGWAMQQISPRAYVPSLKQIGDRPAIAYVEHLANNDRRLMYALAPNTSGYSAQPWSLHEVAVLDNATYDYYHEMEAINGRPAIAYRGPSYNKLSYSRANTADGSGGWGAPVTIDTGGNQMGLHPSLEQVAGSPAIAYFEHFDNQLRYARATTADGSAAGDWQKIALETAGSIYPTLAVINGNPAVAYWHSPFFADDPYGWAYQRSSTPDGMNAADWTKVIIDEPSLKLNWVSHIGFTTVDGHPAMAGLDPVTNHYRYFRSTTPLGLSAADWSERLDLPDPEFPDDGITAMDLVVYQGGPLFGFNGRDGNSLRFWKSATPTGASQGDWSLQQVETPGNILAPPTFAVINGRLAIAAYMYDTQNLAHLVYGVLF